MFFTQACVMPHPPLIVPAVGGGREREIRRTTDACEEIARLIAEAKPELIIFITPHGNVYGDYFHISPGDGAKGDFSRFGAPEAKTSLSYDEEFIWHVEALAKEAGIPAGTMGGRGDDPLDHGVTVPMHFINRHWENYKAVRVSVSGLPTEAHYNFGKCLAQAIEEMKRKAVIVASGDLSHKLTKDGPYGFAPEGPAFDGQISEALANKNFSQLLRFEPAFIEKAAECGLRPCVMLAGALDGRETDAARLSYEGPFGVGYGVFSFTNIRKSESVYVRLARETLEHYVNTRRIPPMPDYVTQDMLAARAGTFVSIKKNGGLRGCIGTIEPYRQNIAEEIRGNAISAATQDPRFPAISPGELPELEISVDVLSPAEPVNSAAELDVRRYGVIVTQGRKRGLLLPNLDGVDTVAQQVSIALQKAGINAGDDYAMERFEVVRHT
jgi:AmmeMemoRadiSam system protein A